MKYDFVNTILHGTAQDQLKALEADSIDCVITSPPYWALRDYKTEGQLGLEPTFQEYITKLVDIFSQVRRVLKRSGACWVNLGDTYSSIASHGYITSNRSKNKNDSKQYLPKRWRGGMNENANEDEDYRNGYCLFDRKKSGLPEKSLCLIPERFAIAMVDAGWILRNKIIWYKPNCMPSSAKDRFTVDWEYLFFFTKSQRYYFETQYEPIDKGTPRKYESGFTFPRAWREEQMPRQSIGKVNWQLSPLGRIKRAVWKIATQPFSEAHFATFPPALVKTPLLATCPEYVCRKCGKAREKVYQKAIEYKASTPYGKYNEQDKQMNAYRAQSNLKTLRDLTGVHEPYFLPKETGLTDCGCNAGFDAGIVLDPFLGSGTVAMVALQNARNFIGCELNQSYIDMSLKRLEPYLLQTRLI